MNRFIKPAGVLASVALALALTGCGKSVDSGGGTSADGVKTGPGVTDSAITLGALAITSGPAASLGNDALQGAQVELERINGAGGVCHRKLALEVRDTAFDPQRAVAAYNEIGSKVAGFAQLLGSASTAALVDSIEKDGVLTMAGGFSADLLGYEHLQVPGSTYDVDMINGLEFLARKAGLKAGDKVGHVYIEGEAGSNAVAGSKYAAKKLGLQIVEQEVAPTATDLSAQVAALEKAGVKAVLLTALPPLFASFVGVSAATAFNVPILATAPSFAPQLLATPLAPALEHVYIAAAEPALVADLPGVKDFMTAYQAQFPDGKPSQTTLIASVLFRMLTAGLQAACDDKDLSREGITKAFRSISDFDTGFNTTYDLTDPAVPPSTTTYILQPSRQAVGGLVEVQPGATSPVVEDYFASK